MKAKKWLVVSALIALQLISFSAKSADYEEVDSEVGCKSKYSEEKKNDIFESVYKDTWMTWSGTVILPKANSTAVNVDGKGVQDLKVTFADDNAGYDLKEGDTITVKFLMKLAGGCFLPFTGEKAVIQ